MSEQLIKFKTSTYGDKCIDAKVENDKDNRAVIYGVVVDKNDKPVSDAVVKLILLEDPSDFNSTIPVTHTFTDEYGQFLFGPLPPDKTYLVKIWYDDIYIRKVTIADKEERHSCITIRGDVNQDKQTKKLPINHSEK